MVTAAMDGNMAQVKSLLGWGADPNVDFKGLYALEQAADHGDERIVRLLLAHGASTNTVNWYTKQTALVSAQKNGHMEIVKMLKQAGATH